MKSSRRISETSSSIRILSIPPPDLTSSPTTLHNWLAKALMNAKLLTNVARPQTKVVHDRFLWGAKCHKGHTATHRAIDHLRLRWKGPLLKGPTLIRMIRESPLRKGRSNISSKTHSWVDLCQSQSLWMRSKKLWTRTWSSKSIWRSLLMRWRPGKSIETLSITCKRYLTPYSKNRMGSSLI